MQKDDEIRLRHMLDAAGQVLELNQRAHSLSAAGGLQGASICAR